MGKRKMVCSSRLAIAGRSVESQIGAANKAHPARVFIPFLHTFFGAISRLSLSDLLVWAGGKRECMIYR